SDRRALQPTTSVQDPERALVRTLVRTVAREPRPPGDADAAHTSSAPTRPFKRQIDCSPESARDSWGASWGR
ncbi:MAG: hypothetical protein ACXW61_08445, partial [Gemmatirosa sp.]